MKEHQSSYPTTKEKIKNMVSYCAKEAMRHTFIIAINYQNDWLDSEEKHSREKHSRSLIDREVNIATNQIWSLIQSSPTTVNGEEKK